MNSEFMDIFITPTIQISLIVGLAEVFKRCGLESQWIPAIDVILGLLVSFCMYDSNRISERIIIGICLGLEACGLFSGVKNMLK